MKINEQFITEVFNTDNYKRIGFTTKQGYKLKGWISKSDGFSKGSLILNELYEPNGKYYEILQYVQGMPKIRFFDRDWKYIKNKDINSIYLLEKLDGTNIVYFPIYLHDEIIEVANKTRGMPNVDLGFSEKIDETNQEDGIRELVFNNPNSYSFELYGYKNRIVIEYPFPIRLTLLCIMKWRYIYPYNDIVGLYDDHILPLFTFKDNYTIEFREGGNIHYTDYLDLYYKIEEFLDAINSDKPKYEGIVWNIEYNNENHLYKNKSRKLKPLYSDLPVSIVKELVRQGVEEYGIELEKDSLIEFVSKSLESDYGEQYVKKNYNRIESVVKRILLSDKYKTEDWIEIVFNEVNKELNSKLDDLRTVMTTYADICPKIIGDSEFCRKKSSKFFNYIIGKK